MAAPSLPALLLMGFDKRLASLRKERGLTQQALADKAGMHVVQIRRYETDVSQPSIEAIKKLATALAISTDALLFDGDERGPSDEFRLKFEAIAKLDDDEKEALVKVIDSMLHMHDAKRWLQPAAPANKKAS